MYFQKNLEFLKKRSGESQESIAEFVGVSQGTVSNWERGGTPQPDQLNKIAQFFAVSVNDLIHTELPHRENIQALSELRRALEELKTEWAGMAKKMKEKAEHLSGQREYASAAENEWGSASMEFCSQKIDRLLKAFFQDAPDAQTKVAIAEPPKPLAQDSHAVEAPKGE